MKQTSTLNAENKGANGMAGLPLPLVSIIVITFNSSKYVFETLESARAQTYQNIELIVSDDCSTDNTYEICKNWIETNKNRFARTELIEARKNTGIPGNCNRGLRIAGGEWIKFIAGDDILLNNCIEEMIFFSNINNSYISTSALEEFCEDGLPLRIHKNDYLRFIKFFKKNNINQFKSYVRNPVFLNSPAILFRKELFDKIGFFDESFRMLEDQPFLLKALHAGYNIHYNEKVTVRYRTTTKEKDRILGQQDDYYLCFKLYRQPFLNKLNIIDIFILYNFFLMHRIKKTNNIYTKFIYRILFNFTDPIYIINKLSRER